MSAFHSNLINTSLQRGDSEPRATGNRFNGLSGELECGESMETVKTVGNVSLATNTALKRGVNEKRGRSC